MRISLNSSGAEVDKIKMDKFLNKFAYYSLCFVALHMLRCNNIGEYDNDGLLSFLFKSSDILLSKIFDISINVSSKWCKQHYTYLKLSLAILSKMV